MTIISFKNAFIFILIGNMNQIPAVMEYIKNNYRYPSNIGIQMLEPVWGIFNEFTKSDDPFIKWVFFVQELMKKIEGFTSESLLDDKIFYITQKRTTFTFSKWTLEDENVMLEILSYIQSNAKANEIDSGWEIFSKIIETYIKNSKQCNEKDTIFNNYRSDNSCLAVVLANHYKIKDVELVDKYIRWFLLVSYNSKENSSNGIKMTIATRQIDHQELLIILDLLGLSVDIYTFIDIPYNERINKEISRKMSTAQFGTGEKTKFAIKHMISLDTIKMVEFGKIVEMKIEGAGHYSYFEPTNENIKLSMRS